MPDASIGILTRVEETRAAGWHVRDLERAARKRGVSTQRLDFTAMEASWNGEAHFACSGSDMTTFRAIVVRSMPRGSLEQVIYRMDILQRLEAAGVRLINRPRALEAAIDKVLSCARIAAAGLPVPTTIACEHGPRAMEAFRRLGARAVLKPIFGSEGKGITLIEDESSARTLLLEGEPTAGVFLLQEVIEHPGYDFRVLVAGGEVVGAIRRVARDGLITNVSQGGQAEPAVADEWLGSLAKRAAACLGAEVAGVDVAPDRDGNLRILEVNAVPGWRAFSRTLDIDVADMILSRALAPSPESRQLEVRP